MYSHGMLTSYDLNVILINCVKNDVILYNGQPFARVTSKRTLKLIAPSS